MDKNDEWSADHEAKTFVCGWLSPHDLVHGCLCRSDANAPAHTDAHDDAHPGLPYTDDHAYNLPYPHLQAGHHPLA